MKLYREVRTEHRLPPKSVLVIAGYDDSMYTASPMQILHTDKWVNRNSFIVDSPDWWLEEVELPSEKEIELEVFNYGLLSGKLDYGTAFNIGINWLKERIEK